MGRKQEIKNEIEWRSAMKNFIEIVKKEVPQLENAIKKVDLFLNHAPEGCLKWQNKNGKTYYYH